MGRRRYLGTILPLLVTLALAPRANAEEPPAKKYAVLIGFQHYTSDWFPLPYAAQDLKRMIRVLSDGGFEQQDMFVVSDVRREDLVDLGQAEELEYSPMMVATRNDVGGPSIVSAGYYKSEVLAVVEQAARNASLSPGATLLVYFTGHGITLGEDTRYVAMPSSIPSRESDLIAVGDLTNTIASYTTGATSLTKLVIIDACAVKGEGRIRVDIPPSRERFDLGLFLASAVDQRSYYDGPLGSVYTHYLSEALRSRIGQARVDLSTIARALEDKVPRHVRGMRGRTGSGSTGMSGVGSDPGVQVPTEIGVDGRFLNLRSVHQDL